MNTDIPVSVKPEYPVIDRNTPFTKPSPNSNSSITSASPPSPASPSLWLPIRGSSMVTGGMICLLGGFMYAYQNSSDGLVGFSSNDGEVAKYKK